jgi:hypothetical protein
MSDKASWIEALKSFIAAARERRPALTENQLDPLTRRQRAIHASVTVEFQRQAGEALQERRGFLEAIQGYAKDPVCVLTGDAAFLAAFRIMYPDDRVLTGKANFFFPLLDEEYGQFLAAHPEPREFEFHVHWWSLFDPPAPREPSLTAQVGQPIDPAGRYLDHRIGFLWGPHHGSEWSSLWRLDGSDLSLIRQDYLTIRY